MHQKIWKEKMSKRKKKELTTAPYPTNNDGNDIEHEAKDNTCTKMKRRDTHSLRIATTTSYNLTT